MIYIIYEKWEWEKDFWEWFKTDMFFTSASTFLLKIVFQYILLKVLEDPDKN